MVDKAASKREHLIAEVRQLSAAMRPAKMHRAAPLMELDLTIPQLRVVFLLAESEPMSMGSLSQELGITLSACTHLVDRLVNAGFATRGEDPHDRRVVRCALTEKGQALAERVRQAMPLHRQEFLDRLMDKELRTIVQALTIVHRVITEMEAEHAGASAEGSHAGRNTQ